MASTTLQLFDPQILPDFRDRDNFYAEHVNKFQTLNPLEQRLALFQQKEQAGCWLTFGSFVFHVYGGASDRKKRHRDYVIYSTCIFIFQNHYQRICTNKKILPEDTSDFTKLQYEDFCAVWMKETTNRQKVQIIQKLIQNINYLSKPILQTLADQMQQAIHESPSLQAQLASVFVLREVSSRFLLPLDLQKKITLILKEIARERVHYQVREIALEGLKFLGCSYWAEKIKAKVSFFVKNLWTHYFFISFKYSSLARQRISHQQ